ncbi:MAG TPA: PDZ domain-containing protein [Firmicutes bacterium]|nr:PDZ domain-containing protein [Bacillota bacterium]
MANVWELIKVVLQTFPMMVTDLRYILIVAVVFVLVYRQYNKVLNYEMRMFNLKRLKPFQETITALIYGIGGGLTATALFVGLGVSLSNAGIAYLWLTALFLMLIHPRFLCFAYAGGLVSLVSLLTGYPELDIASVMALVAILHLVEALLIFINGHDNPSPMYFKHANGDIVGGFTMQKFWPMPTIALLGVAILNSGAELQTVAMPSWWPIFRTGVTVPANHVLVHVLFPIVVALGYSDFVQTELPRTKAKRSAGHLLIYSIVLLAFAILGNKYRAFVILAVLFAPLGHELIIHLGQKRERDNDPVFQCDDGVMVLAVYPNSPAEEMGLGPGDVIKSVNGIAVGDLPELLNQVTPWLIDPVFVIENEFRAPQKRVVEYKGKVPPFGIIPVPHPRQGVYVQIKEGFLKRWLRKLRPGRK